MSGADRAEDTVAGAPSVDLAGERGERRPGWRAAGLAAARVAAPIVVRRGGGVLVRLKSEWPAIVGPDWAAVTWPSALGRDGVLKLRAASAAALELQHRAPLLIERINGFFGRVVVTRLLLVQGPLPVVSPPSRAGLSALADCATDQIAGRVSGVADPQLRQALARLGRAVAGAKG